jgi:tight adherence protein C
MDITLLMTILVFSGIVVLFVGIFFLVRYQVERRKVVKKIEYEGRKVPGKTEGKAPPREHFAKIASVIGNIAKPKDEENLSRMQKSLFNVGYRSGNAVLIFFGIKIFCTILLPLGFSFIKIFIHRPMPPLFIMFIYILLAMVGFYLPSIWLRIKTNRRKEEIKDGFPDMLDLLVVCVEAGMGLDSALVRVGDEMKLGNKAISDEFNLLNTQMRLGKARQDALRALASRVNLDDVKNLVTVLVQTEKFGTSVGTALRTHSDFMRVERRQRAEEKAVKLPIKLLIPLIFCIFPSLFIVILGPALIQVFRIMQ